MVTEIKVFIFAGHEEIQKSKSLCRMWNDPFFEDGTENESSDSRRSIIV